MTNQFLIHHSTHNYGLNMSSICDEDSIFRELYIGTSCRGELPCGVVKPCCHISFVRDGVVVEYPTVRVCYRQRLIEVRMAAEQYPLSAILPHLLCTKTALSPTAQGDRGVGMFGFRSQHRRTYYLKWQLDQAQALTRAIPAANKQNDIIIIFHQIDQFVVQMVWLDFRRVV